MAQSSAYNEQYHDDWAWSLALKGATDEEMAEAFGISVRTLHRWKKKHSSLMEKITEGKDIADAKVERCLYQRATGYDAKDLEQILETDRETGRQVISRTRVFTKHVSPDTMAIMYWLNNRKRKDWSQRQEVDIAADGEGAEVHIYLPDNGRDRGG